jgi:hypothetical protein
MSIAERSIFCAELHTGGKTEQNRAAAVYRGEAAIASDFNNRTRLERTTQSYSYPAHAYTINWSKVEIMNIDRHSDGYSVQMHMHKCGVEALASVAALPLHAAASL